MASYQLGLEEVFIHLMNRTSTRRKEVADVLGSPPLGDRREKNSSRCAVTV